jgi:hypothetical protein
MRRIFHEFRQVRGRNSNREVQAASSHFSVLLNSRISRKSVTPRWRDQLVCERSVGHIARMTSDPHAALRDRVFQSVLQDAGESERSIRNAAASGVGVPADLASLVGKIHNHAYQVTDADIARVQPRYGDDQMFEIIVSAALGASRKRLLAGLEALDEA